MSGSPLTRALTGREERQPGARAVRGQWAIESKYHARRDGAYCEDIRTRRCDENVTGAMLLARSPVFVFLAKSGMENCQAFKEELQSDRNLVFRPVPSSPEKSKRRNRAHD